MSKEKLEKMKKAIGYADLYAGRDSYLAYRNIFLCTQPDSDWEELVREGLAYNNAAQQWSAHLISYIISERGFALLEQLLGCRINRLGRAG